MDKGKLELLCNEIPKRGMSKGCQKNLLKLVKECLKETPLEFIKGKRNQGRPKNTENRSDTTTIP